jgi:glycosyltransferase involved in cell wall biosynthesis
MAPSVAIVGTRGYPSYYGGFETAVRKLAPYLVDHGWEVVVYGRKGSTKEDDPSRDMRIETVVTRGIESKSLSTLSYGAAAMFDAAKRRPDVVLVMNVANGFWLPILQARGIPTLMNVDGIEWDRAKWGRFAKKVFVLGARASAKRASRLVFDARAIAERWERDFGRFGDFIPYGGDIPEPDLPIEPGLTHRKYVLAVARFVPENSIPEFIAAAAIVAENHDVVIVGSSGYEGELDEAVRSLTRSNPRVRWLGHISDDKRLHSLWQHAGAYFHGHSVGGTNPALVQAMACGAPTVARDTIYNREVLGADGALFTRAEPKAIAQSLIELLDDPDLQERFSTAVLDRAQAEYQWSSICDRYERAMLELIRGQHG